MILYFVTGNQGKVREFRSALEPLGHTVDQLQMPYPEIQADSLEEVARFGARWLVERTERFIVLEDSGLFIDSLEGFPGVYSAYVYQTVGLEGVLKLMTGMDVERRSATFRSVIAMCSPGREPDLFIGECSGRISTSLAGEGGFGYDPLFVPDGEKRTFAQMDVEEKNRLSHRGRALDAMVHVLSEPENG